MKIILSLYLKLSTCCILYLSVEAKTEYHA